MIIALALLTSLVAFVAMLYNRLVRERLRVDAAWSDIDVQLQRRHDLIPQIVNAVKQYASYEAATLEAIAALRSEAMNMAGDIDARGDKEQQLGDQVHRLIAVAEDYPELKANENFLNLQTELVETENYLQFARRFYNGSVRALNTRIETVPNNLVAGAFGFVPKSFFQKAADDVAAVPLVDLGNIE